MCFRSEMGICSILGCSSSRSVSFCFEPLRSLFYTFSFSLELESFTPSVFTPILLCASKFFEECYFDFDPTVVVYFNNPRLNNVVCFRMPAPNFYKTDVGDLWSGDSLKTSFWGAFLYCVLVGWAILSFYVLGKSLQA